MSKPITGSVLREMLREQIYCLGRAYARHRVPEEALWEIVKGFDALYQRARRKLETPRAGSEPTLPRWLKPHPGLLYLLDKLDQEETGEDRRSRA